MKRTKKRRASKTKSNRRRKSQGSLYQKVIILNRPPQKGKLSMNDAGKLILKDMAAVGVSDAINYGRTGKL